MNNIKVVVATTVLGLMMSGVAMAEPEAGNFTLNFESHVPSQEISVSKISFSHKIMEEASFLDLDYLTND